MACWDLKEFDYSHTDIIGDKIDGKRKESKKSVFFKTEVFE